MVRLPLINDILGSIQVKLWINQLTLYPFQKAPASLEDCDPEPA